MHHKLIVFLLVLVLSLAAVLPAAATPCAFGAAYDPACDVDQDGDIDVLDIQLTAGHWNQTGTWTGGGEGWLLSGNAGTNPTTNYIGTTDGQPLVMQPVGGNVGIGTRTPGARFNVVGTSWFQGDSTPLPAAAGKGIAIGFTGEQGYIYGFDYATWTHKNLIVQHDGGKVVIGSSTPAAGKLTVVGGASEHGVHVVSSANTDGVYVGSAGRNGLTVVSAGYNGLVVVSAPINGLVVESAGVHGIDVAGNAYAGVFHGNIFVTGNCVGCLQVNFAVNAGERTLQPGDVVSIQAVTTTDFDTGPALWQVTQAQPGQAVVGVVAGRAELVTEEEHRPTETGKLLVSREGAAQPGEYVTIVYSGPMQVKVASGENAIAAGMRLTAAADGAVRPLGVIKVQLAGGEGTADVPESAPVIGVALEAAGDGLVWVLVNPQ